jgi:hypothetical protein
LTQVKVVPATACDKHHAMSTSVQNGLLPARTGGQQKEASVMTLPANLFGPTQGPRRGGRAQDRDVTDPYKRTKKLQEPTVCPQCAAVYIEGRWCWAERPANANEELCQACHRINDNFPAGVVTLSGDFLAGHKDDIMNIVRRQEEIEMAEHPFNRIMAINPDPEQIEITTTDLHLPRRIGTALKSAYDGNLDMTYEEDGYFVRVNWRRDG